MEPHSANSNGGSDPAASIEVRRVSLTFEDKRVNGLHHGNAGYRLAVRDLDGKWLNAVEKNFGGVKMFVKGPWKSSYGLGTYGVDTLTRTAWAVINYDGDFAVVRFDD